MGYRWLLWLFFCLNVWLGSASELQSYIGHSFEQNILTVEVSDGTYSLKALTDDVVMVSFSNQSVNGNTLFAPIIDDAISVTFKETEDQLSLSTKNVTVEILKSSVALCFYLKDVLKVNQLHFSSRGDTIAYRYHMTDDEKIFGTGARALAMDRRGYRFQCYNQANYGYGMETDFLNYSIPHVMSSNRYMLLFDNPAKSWFDIGKRDKAIFEFSSLGGNSAVYFIGGDSYNGLIGKYTELTGKQPLIPLWALGNLQSRFGYETQAEAEAIVDSMLAAGYPLDALIIDLYWFGEQMQDGLMGNLSWDRKNWPEPEKMIARFKEKGVKTITISEPFFTRKSQHFKTLDRQKLLGLDAVGNTLSMPNFYFGDAGLLDVFKPEARDWLWEQYDAQKHLGVEGWWCDLGEPEVHPDTMLHVNGKASELHGVYGHEWTSVFYKNYAKYYPNERLFVMGRAGFAGSQRYGLIPWSGDVGRTWSGLRAQVPVMLGAGISGLAYMHSDAGGFAAGEKTPELYTRWLQFATFSPIFRPHSDPHAEPEPIFYDPDVQSIVKRYIKLRYALLPYNYTLAWQAHTTGIPLARSLFTSYNDAKYAANDSLYFWGDNFLIAPVNRAGIQHLKVALPPGKWFSFWDGSQFEGDQLITVDVTMENIPVFVKAGSFIPMVAQEFQNTDHYNTEKLKVHYYHDATVKKANDRMYVDDGKTKGAFEKGLYEFLDFEFADGVFTISNTGSTYDNRPKQRTIELIVHNAKFTKACAGWKKVKKQIDETQSILEFKLKEGEKIIIATK